MSREHWTPDDDRDAAPAFLDRFRRPVAVVQEVIDLPVLRPEQDRVAKFVGKCIGIAIVYVVAGLMWAVWGIAWTVEFVAARVRAAKEA